MREKKNRLVAEKLEAVREDWALQRAFALLSDTLKNRMTVSNMGAG